MIDNVKLSAPTGLTIHLARGAQGKEFTVTAEVGPALMAGNAEERDSITQKRAIWIILQQCWLP